MHPRAGGKNRISSEKDSFIPVDRIPAPTPVSAHGKALVRSLLLAILSAGLAGVHGADFKPLEGGKPATLERHLLPLSPEDELKTIQLPDGYRLELVLSEPDIREPMAISFDGNGRMYVVEMRTYMQDINATGEHEPRSRVSRHESSRADGIYDRHHAFADNLLLPRMVLPLQDEVLIGVTDTSDIVAWRDRNNDGIAEEKRVFYSGGPRGGNMEHQPSGLLWAMDNWIYTTYNAYRLRWTPDGRTLKEPTAPNGGQWGLTQDDWGKPWFSNGGGERGVWNFQTHIAYGAVNVPSQWPEDWMAVWPAIGLGDVQGGPGRLRPDGTLNHFTATCGQEVFRGDRLPGELRGNVFLPEPVGRLIRRGVVEVRDGITTIHNPHGQSEFIRSTDANFRPVNMATGPDGCLYIVDTYRGIIQEGSWTRPDSFLRPQIQRWGLDKNIGRGRIWRLVHKDFKPGPQPRMLEEPASALVKHLEHPNGWWRDTAQRLLVVRQDKSVESALLAMASTSTSPQARAHAWWTLEGLGLMTESRVGDALKDTHPRVRENAIRISETVMKSGATNLLTTIQALVEDPDPNVVLQAIGTSKRMNAPGWPAWADKVLLASRSEGVRQIGKAMTAPARPANESFTPAETTMLKRGEAIYRELCFACHGIEGEGMAQQGAAPGATLGPPLKGSKTVNGHRDAAVMVLLHGLAGPVNGVTYEAQMVPMSSNPDDWIAAVASYIRNSFGNRSGFVTEPDVARLRNQFASRSEPWTEASLRAILPAPLTNSRSWKLTASASPERCRAAIDGRPNTRWDTAKSQAPGQWFQIEMPEAADLSGIRLDTRLSPDDFPRGYKVELSLDGSLWMEAVANGTGRRFLTDINFSKTRARFVRITQTGSVEGKFWSIHELQLLAAQ